MIVYEPVTLEEAMSKQAQDLPGNIQCDSEDTFRLIIRRCKASNTFYASNPKTLRIKK